MTSENEQPKAWQRQENESAKAFHAFILYRDMLAKGRSIQKVQEKLDKSAGYYRHLANWSSKYQWVKRATAHDDHIAEVKREKQEEAILEMADRQIKEGMALQLVGMRRFHNRQGDIREIVAGTMDDRDAIRAIEIGAKIERLARGEPVEITKQDLTIQPKRMEDYTDEELEFIIKSRGQLPPGVGE